VGAIANGAASAAIARVSRNGLLAAVGRTGVAVLVQVIASSHGAGPARAIGCGVSIGADIRTATAMAYVRASVLLAAVVCVTVATHVSGVARGRASPGTAGRGAVRIGAGNTARNAITRRIEQRFATICSAAAAIAVVRVATAHLAGA